MHTHQNRCDGVTGDILAQNKPPLSDPTNHPPPQVKLRHNKRRISLQIRSEQEWRKQIEFNVRVSRKSYGLMLSSAGSFTITRAPARNPRRSVWLATVIRPHQSDPFSQLLPDTDRKEPISSLFLHIWGCHNPSGL